MNRHSLQSLEIWLRQLGAEQSTKDPCSWIWSFSHWSAQIQMEQDELKVTWDHNGITSQCSFSYGLSRSDVEVAIKEGPSNK